jgi:hypothetical protein
MVSNEMAFNLLCGKILPSSAQVEITLPKYCNFVSDTSRGCIYTLSLYNYCLVYYPKDMT